VSIDKVASQLKISHDSAYEIIQEKLQVVEKGGIPNNTWNSTAITI
jgi:hypothetical protein